MAFFSLVLDLTLYFVQKQAVRACGPGAIGDAIGKAIGDAIGSAIHTAQVGEGDAWMVLRLE